jgi:hypothetical protein
LLTGFENEGGFAKAAITEPGRPKPDSRFAPVFDGHMNNTWAISRLRCRAFGIHLNIDA